ncbi:MAG: hypothetical protein IPO17_13610 [Flavobacteriales bacterium]|nr:hypothetical protein [Flavobacteriales bacterium]
MNNLRPTVDSVATRCRMTSSPAWPDSRPAAPSTDNSRAEAKPSKRRKFWRAQWKQDVKSDAKRADHATAESVREGELFQKERELDTDKQLEAASALRG